MARQLLMARMLDVFLPKLSVTKKVEGLVTTSHAVVCVIDETGGASSASDAGAIAPPSLCCQILNRRNLNAHLGSAYSV